MINKMSDLNFIGTLDKVEALINWQHSNPSFCEKLLAFWYTSLLKHGDSFVDVGARVGHHFVPMSRAVAKNGRSLAIEANKEVAQELQEKIAAIRNLPEDGVVRPVAVSDSEGKLEFYIRKDFQGWSSLYESHVHPNEKGDVEVTEVSVTTIDKIVIDELQWDSCDFIKLDIEHAEYSALKGAKTVLQKMKPFVVFENSPRVASKLNNYTLPEFINYFNQIDYCLYDIYFNEITLDRLTKDKKLPSYYIAFHNSKFESVNKYLGEYDRVCGELMQPSDLAA